jgi:uncharacterized protein (DUF58 family)
VWRTTGARIAVVAEVVIVVVLIVDVAWSVWVTEKVSIAVVDHPHDATVGDPVSTEILVRGRRSPVEVRMLSAAHPTWYRIDPPDRGTLVAVARTRGVAGAAVFEIRGSAPLGLLGHRVRMVVELRHSLVVGPRPEPVEGARFPDRGAVPSAEEVVRGTRPWVQGDPLRSVHWPSVARSGELMVKELEPPPAPQVVIAVDLALPVDAAEHAAARGAWVAEEALRRGNVVTLWTIEGDRPVGARVRSPLEVRRRLAAASIGSRFASPPEAGPVIWIRTEGDTFP